MKTKSALTPMLFFIITVLAFFRFSYLGFSYTPYLDDYIQYSFYPSYENPWQNILTGGAGILFTRPLAGLLDFFLWSRFYKNLGILVAALAVLYGASAVFFYKGLKGCGINVGTVFFVVFLFSPINTEATYWLSASTRISLSLFLASLSFYFATEKKTVLFFIFNFLSMWLYEQTAILSFFIGAFAAWEKKFVKTILIAAMSAFLLAVFYVLFANMGDNKSRIEMVDGMGIIKNIYIVLKDFIYAFFVVQFKIITRGFVRGFNIIAEDFSLIWISVLVILSIFFFNLGQDIEKNFKIRRKTLFIGVCLAIFPLIPFFITSENPLNVRNITPSLLGIAIVLDNLGAALFKKYAALLSAALIFFFSVATVSETVDYEFTAKKDFHIASEICQRVDQNTKEVSVKISLPSYYTQNAPWRDHIISMTASDWGPTGIVRVLSGNKEMVVKIKK